MRDGIPTPSNLGVGIHTGFARVKKFDVAQLGLDASPRKRPVNSGVAFYMVTTRSIVVGRENCAETWRFGGGSLLRLGQKSIRKDHAVLMVCGKVPIQLVHREALTRLHGMRSAAQARQSGGANEQ